MELGGDLQTLVEKAWVVLHGGLNEEIDKINCSFCRFCSKHGHYCSTVKTPFQEKEGLVAIEDSLKEVGNVLILLQHAGRSVLKKAPNSLYIAVCSTLLIAVTYVLIENKSGGPRCGLATKKQRLRSWQPIDRQESLARLEESRSVLMEKIAQYQGRPLGVVEELNAVFSNGKTVFQCDEEDQR